MWTYRYILKRVHVARTWRRCIRVFNWSSNAWTIRYEISHKIVTAVAEFSYHWVEYLWITQTVKLRDEAVWVTHYLDLFVKPFWFCSFLSFPGFIYHSEIKGFLPCSIFNGLLHSVTNLCSRPIFVITEDYQVPNIPVKWTLGIFTYIC